jgi:MFS family permease
MKKTILLIIIFFFFQGIFHNLGHPVTPAFVRGLGINDYMFGVFFASMSFGLMLGAPIWGTLGDLGHRRRYILLGLVLYSIGQIGFAYSEKAYLMVIFRFISGFGVVGSMTIMTGYMIELSSLKDRARYLAYAAAVVTLGSSLGYYIGGFIATNSFFVELLGTDDYRLIFLIQAILNLVYAFTIYFTLTDPKEAKQVTSRASFIKGLKEITHVKPSLLLFLISLTLITIGAINLSKYIDIYFDELGYNPQQLGTFVMATGIVSLAASILIVPYFARFKKQLKVIAVIHLLSAIIIFYVFRAPAFLLTMYTVFMIYVVLKAVYQPLEQNYISLHAKEGKYGSVMGLRQSFISIGMVIGPLLGGFLYEVRPVLLFDFSGFAFIAGVILLGVVYMIEKKGKRNENNHESESSH